MEYTVQRKRHHFWSWYAEQERAGTALALQELLEQPDGAETVTSHVGRDHIRRDLDLGFTNEDDWPVTITPRGVRRRRGLRLF